MDRRAGSISSSPVAFPLQRLFADQSALTTTVKKKFPGKRRKECPSLPNEKIMEFVMIVITYGKLFLQDLTNHSNGLAKSLTRLFFMNTIGDD